MEKKRKLSRRREAKGPPQGAGEAVEALYVGPPKLTRFEKARIVGARATQLAMGAPVLVEIPKGTTSIIEIVELELKECVLPMSIRRVLPNGTGQLIPLKLLLQLEGLCKGS